MSQMRRDIVDVERLIVNEKRLQATNVTGVQSATIGENVPSVMLYGIGSVDIVNHLPAESTNDMKELEFFVGDTSSANLILKNLSGDLKVVVPPNGYGRAVCIRGVWYGAEGGVQNRLSQVALGATYSAGFGSAASAVGFSSITEAQDLVDLVNKLAALAKAHGWAVT